MHDGHIFYNGCGCSDFHGDNMSPEGVIPCLIVDYLSVHPGGSVVPAYKMTSGTSSRYIGYNRDDNVGTMEPNTITILEIEPDVLITQFVAQTLSKKT